MTNRSPYDVTLQELIEHVLALGGTVEIGVDDDGGPYLRCNALIDGEHKRDKVCSSGVPDSLSQCLQRMAGYSAFNPERADGMAPRKPA